MNACIKIKMTKGKEKKRKEKKKREEIEWSKWLCEVEVE